MVGPRCARPGPAMDAGYYLIRLKHFRQRLFEAIDWSTERVYRQTMMRAGEIGLRVVSLPEWYDVDDEGTLAVLGRELLRDPAAQGAYRGGYAAPNTTVFRTRLAVTNGGVRHLIGCAPASS